MTPIFTQEERDAADKKLVQVSRSYLKQKWAGIRIGNTYPYDDVTTLLAVLEARELRILELESSFEEAQTEAEHYRGRTDYEDLAADR
jgi:hypothetical protein